MAVRIDSPPNIPAVTASAKPDVPLEDAARKLRALADHLDPVG